MLSFSADFGSLSRDASSPLLSLFLRVELRFSSSLSSRITRVSNRTSSFVENRARGRSDDHVSVVRMSLFYLKRGSGPMSVACDEL